MLSFSRLAFFVDICCFMVMCKLLPFDTSLFEEGKVWREGLCQQHLPFSSDFYYFLPSAFFEFILLSLPGSDSRRLDYWWKIFLLFDTDSLAINLLLSTFFFFSMCFSMLYFHFIHISSQNISNFSSTLLWATPFLLVEELITSGTDLSLERRREWMGERQEESGLRIPWDFFSEKFEPTTD